MGTIVLTYKVNNKMNDEDDYDALAYTQRLKAAIHYTVGQISEDIQEQNDGELAIEKRVVGVLSETTYKYSQTLARDLALFAKHANRKTINVDDVLLAVRKSSSLKQYLAEMNRETQENKPAAVRKKKTNKTQATNASNVLNEDDDSNSNMAA